MTVPSDKIGFYLDQWPWSAEDDFAWVASMVSRITYKPGWHIEPHRRPELGGAAVSFMTMVPDARQELLHAKISLGATFIVPHHILQDHAEDRFWLWIQDRLHYIECHESDEWFRVDGQIRFDPHRFDARV